MRRFAAGTAAFVVMTGTFLVMPVYAEPGPEAVPVETSSEEVLLGSVAAPAPAADVREGTTEPVAGVPDGAPALTVSRTDVAEFSLVGVTWAADPAVTDVRVQVRVQDTDGAWGEWTEVGPEDAEQEVGADSGAELRGGTAPVWTGPSTGVEAELVTRSGAAPADVQLELIDPGESPADAVPGTPDIQDTADAALGMPDVYSRVQWGADPRLMTWGPEYAPTVRAATLHHTASSNDYTADQVPGILRGIYTYHAQTRGWGDIGYHLIVDRFGRRWEGRAGGLASTVVGAHAGGFNTGTWGVSMLGTFETVDPPQAVVDSVAAIIAWKFSLHGVDPRGTVRLTSGGTDKYAAGAVATLPTIFGHRDTKSTSCPGRYGYARLPEIRDRVAATLAGAVQPTLAARYASDAGLRDRLGAPIGTEQTTAGVTWQRYERAYMYWTPSTGAHVVAGAIWGVYMQQGGPAELGAPTTDELPTPDGVGRFNAFSRGSSIYWTPATGAQPVHGAIRDLWARTGWEAGPLGYPVSGELSGAGGRFSRFQRGTVFWTAAGGAVAVHGEIAAHWTELGGLSWAVPTSSVRPVGSSTGSYATFDGYRAIYWSPTTGAHAVQGQIRALWAAAGGTTGVLGYPTSDERRAPGDVHFSTFERGVVYWTPTGGARAVQGAIAGKWTALGALGSSLGLPVTNELSTPDQVGRFNHFANFSSIYWSPTTGAQAVGGQIRDLWAQLGWERGLLRYPTSDERTTPDGRGRYSTFQNGAVFWTPARGPVAVYGAIHARYAALGGVTSALGQPTRSEYTVPSGRASDFEHGRIAWDARTGAVTVTYR